MYIVKKRLLDLSLVKTGYTFRGKIEHDPSGNLCVVQPKDIVTKEIGFEPTMVNQADINALDNHLLKEGQVLVANKGIKFATAVYRGYPRPCIASSSFFVLTLKQDIILPDYLVWFLEQESARDHLINRAITTTIPSINKSAIEDLVVPLPSLETQLYIIKLIQSSTEELSIMRQLITKKSEFYTSHIWEKLNSEIGE